MNTSPSLKLLTPPIATNSLLEYYRQARARLRLAIRNKISLFKGCYPRRKFRYVPTLETVKFTPVEPGDPHLLMNGLRDDVAFNTMHWARSGLCTAGGFGSRRLKAVTLARIPATADPPWVIDIMQGGMKREEAEAVHTKMLEINSMVVAYRNLHAGFIEILEATKKFDCSALQHEMGEGCPANPLAGLPSRGEIRKLKSTPVHDKPEQIFQDEL